MGAARPAGTYVGVVPAAGSSRRMGRSKALLELDGRTFLSRCVNALLEGGCASVIVVVAEGDNRSATVAAEAGGRVLQNPDPGEGPITSLRLALRALVGDVDGIVYLPVDHPAVAPDTVTDLLVAADAEGARLVVPVHAGERGHPAVFARALFPELSDATLQGGARTVVHRHLPDAVLVASGDPGVLADIDTPEAYRRLLSAREGP